VLHETPFVPMESCSAEYELHPAASYVVMPTTYAPGCLGDFTIGVSAGVQVTFQAI
jgi:hypothetical protein